MSKLVKGLIEKQYARQFGDLDGAVLIDISGVKAGDNEAMRTDLNGKQVKVTVVRNALASRAFQGTALEGLKELLKGPNAMVYGGDSVVTVAREVLRWVKQVEALDVKGAIMDGQLFTAAEVDALSKYPTREEAQAQVVQIILTPAQKLAGAIVGPGRKVASLIKAIEEKLEKGETIAKVA